ncbi:MAG: PHP domain-containing protein [Chloroflexota bacterium]
MKIDLHIHTRTGSDGSLSVEEIFQEANKRKINLMSVTDHDSIGCQEKAISLSKEFGISYITGVELNVTFPYNERTISLDFIGYGYDIGNQELEKKLKQLREHRERRAIQILEKLNIEFDKENIPQFTAADIKNIEASVDGAFGRPHIVDYLVKKRIVLDRQEAFDRFLVKCDVPKYPLSISDASKLIRNAGGLFILAHPNEPGGTSLATITQDLGKQAKIIEEFMLEYINGVECWQSRNDGRTTLCYIQFARKHRLIMTGGSDCHQKPIIMGSVNIPDWVANQTELMKGVN